MPILPPPRAFAASVPVLIAGGGACGLTAALAARDAGVDVLVLERDATPQGTTSMSLGAMCAAGTRMQREVGISDSPEQFFADVMARTKGETDPDFVRVITREAGPTVEWLADVHGVPLSVDADWRGLGHAVPRLHAPPDKSGAGLMGRLLQANERAGADLLTRAHVTDLYADSSGKVHGVRVKRPDGTTEDIGCGALILATCGFAANHEMIAKYIPGMGNARTFTWENSQGDAITWGLELGAAVADMGAYQGYGALAYPQLQLFNYTYVIDGGIMVNTEGKRFSDEMADVSGQGVNVLRQPGGVAFIVYDDALHHKYKDMIETRNAMELNAVKFGKDAHELAAALGIPGDAFAQTLADVRAVKNGTRTDDFGRTFAETAQLNPPYAGVKVTGALYHTQGGLVVDGHGQVKRADGSLLPNLFAGGGAARSISGPGASGYIPAAGLCMAMTLGRLAGTAAAKMTGHKK
ncbi:MAG: FAD-dependent oxidoreductase [Rhodospirillaceae bacterium]|nr:FAD-dependent oxidoreductase [Rhodospirillaceae bacterium]